MVHSASALVLTAIGCAIGGFWLWMWSGAGALARRAGVLRLSSAQDSPACSVQRIVWPQLPLLAALWPATAALASREAAGWDASAQCAVVFALLGAMALVAVVCLYFGALPEWAYPGWMARRYYRAHPERAVAELGPAQAASLAA